ncbi:hypothetical protein HT102_00635 [Hoyosella sp. G463]|uniref:Protein PS1 n=1 Tax=Lolliginicoccus lacisalsi TaxID=2742202 RepID=A0A927PKP2_9ACTN|nr:hypothetical protein [Lolliginicoccus lacisalsi]MBD8504994.1 hypothetical protein [Lolliginicoccus lacisalsi]
MKQTAIRATGLAAALAAAVTLSACGDEGNSVGDEIRDGAGQLTESADAAGNQAGDAMSDATESAGEALDSGMDAAGDATDDAMSMIDGDSTTATTVDGTEVTLEGGIAEKYNELDGELGDLVSAPAQVGDGMAAELEDGTIYWSESAGTYVVQGEILRVYIENGGPTGELGFPTSDEQSIDGGWESEFENGTITWTDQVGGSFAEEITLE